MNEKRYVVIECKVLGDQYECDADRIFIGLKTLKEIKTLQKKKKDEYGEKYYDKFEVWDVDENGNPILITNYTNYEDSPYLDKRIYGKDIKYEKR